MNKSTSILLVACLVIFDIRITLSTNSRNAHHLESLLFEKDGRARPVREFREILLALNEIWKTPTTLVNTLIKLGEVKDCRSTPYYVEQANKVLRDYGEFINIVKYVKYERERLVERCAFELTLAYVHSSHKIGGKLDHELWTLKEEVRLAKGEKFLLTDIKSPFTTETLAKSIYGYLKKQPDETAKKIGKKIEINKDEFDALYKNSVLETCGKLFSDEKCEKYVGLSKFLLEEVAVHNRLIFLFEPVVRDLMAKVRICLDIESNKDLQSQVYNFVKERERKKGFFRLSCFS